MAVLVVFDLLMSDLPVAVIDYREIAVADPFVEAEHNIKRICCCKESK